MTALKAKSLPLKPDNLSVIAGIQGSKRTESWNCPLTFTYVTPTHTTNNKIIMNEMEFKNKGAKDRAHWREPMGRELALTSSQNYKERNTKGV